MRLQRLDLTRYGRFTEHSLAFGELAVGTPDFHIIYGPNESGKSTALAALLDLLFGIEPRSQYNFLHAYPSMRIGAAVEIDGKLLELTRIKRLQGSLLDGADQAVPEAVVLSQLGTVDRAAYRSMFSLDDESLEAGGEAILQSRGELGTLLFSASAGLPDLSHALAGVRDEIAAFHRPNARTGILHGLKGELARLKDERAALDTAAPDYVRFVDARDRGRERFEAASKERQDFRRQLDAGRRHLDCLPRLADLRAIRAELAPLVTLPDAPARWAEEVVGLIHQEIELATRLAGAEDDIARVKESLAAIVIDPNALALAPQIEGLANAQARYVTAEKDLPDRRLALREVEAAIAGILTKLDRSGAPPASLLLPATLAGRLRSSIEAWSGLAQARENAEAENDRVIEELQAAEEQLATSGVSNIEESAMTVLTTVMATARASDGESRQRLHRRTLTAKQSAFESALAALHPWSGDITALKSVSVPSDLVDWRQASAGYRQEAEILRGERKRAISALERQVAERDALAETTGLSDDVSAGRTRAVREAAWADLRQRLDAASAQAFEDALRRDDLVTAARIGQASDLARLGQLQQAIAVSEVEKGQAETALALVEGRSTEIAERLSQTILAIGAGLADDMGAEALEAWLGRRAEALAAAEAVQVTKLDLAEAVTEARQIRERLEAALKALGLQVPAACELDVLLATGQAALDGEAKQRLLRRQVADIRRQLEQRRTARERAETAIATWQESWHAACALAWFGADSAPPGMVEVREILDALAALDPLEAQRANLADRIEKMSTDQREFAEKIVTIARQLELVTEAAAPLSLFQASRARSEAAKDALGRQRDRQKDLDDAEERHRGLVEAAERDVDQAAVMLAHFGVETLSSVETAMTKLARRTELVQRERQVAEEIQRVFPDQTLDEAEVILGGIDGTALEAELGELEAQFEEVNQRANQLYADYAKAEDQVQAVGGDDAVARLEEQRRTVLMEIEERAVTHLRFAAGALAAESALRLYRDRHRSAMMDRASEAFRIISRNGYRGLATQPGKDGDVLIGLCADGTSKVASIMSKGTRFQLYLALRVAGYHEYVAHRPALPFIADDIMETFDDFRAEETFKVFADLANSGQVIYMTHHYHLCDIARTVCPGVKIHELPQPYPVN